MRDLRARLVGLPDRSGRSEESARQSPSHELRARLDRLLGPGRVIPASQVPPPTPAAPVDRFVPGQRVAFPSGTVYRTEWTAAPDHGHGRLSVHELGSLPFGGVTDLFPEHLAGVEAPGQMAFLDTETTGLAGGAGTVPFLVGVGRWVAGSGFRVVQLFLEDLDREPALLEALALELASVRCLVSYNGRAYDVPLLENRHVLNRRPWPLAGAAHLDLLPPARTLWRHGHADCRLATLERGVLGHRRHGDIPGAEIPALYHHFLRRGATERLAAVFRHNLDDLLSLAGLLWASAHPEEGPALGRGLLHTRRGRAQEAVPLLEAGLEEAGLPRALRCQGLRELARARKRQGHWERALEACAELRRLAPHDPFPVTEAAVVLEHRLGRPAEALLLVEEALAAGPWPPRDREALEHRRARLERKAGER